MGESLVHYCEKKKTTYAFITLVIVSSVKCCNLLSVVQAGIMYIWGEYNYVYSQASGALLRLRSFWSFPILNSHVAHRESLPLPGPLGP